MIWVLLEEVLSLVIHFQTCILHLCLLYVLSLLSILIFQNATVRLASRSGTRDMLLDDFVLGENKTALNPEEVVVSICTFL